MENSQPIRESSDCSLFRPSAELEIDGAKGDYKKTLDATFL
jgi:hypothetical protein